MTISRPTNTFADMKSDDVVSTVTDRDGRIVSASGPGLVDLQCNGYAGTDFNCSADLLTAGNVGDACRAMRKRGVVTILATFITDAPESMAARVRRMTRLRERDESIASTIVGYHVEGPLISAEDGPRGAHARERVTTPADSPNLLDDLQAASGGMIRLLTLAPELPGAMELIARASAQGVVVALGHLDADAETIDQAVAAGAKMSTHLGNGSHTTLPRLDNYVQRQLSDDRLRASFIADGHHVPFATLKNFIRAKQVHRSVLVTDCTAAAGMPPGRYTIGDVVCELGPDGAARLPGTPYLAGSALTMDRAVLNTWRNCDVPFETAWAMASTQPAEILGLTGPEDITVDITEEGFLLRR